MLQKYLLAFVGGGLLVGGIVYLAISRHPAPQPAPPVTPVEATQPQALPAAPPTAETAAPAPSPESAPAKTTEPAAASRTARKSAVPVPARRQPSEPVPSAPEPVQVAQAQPQQQQQEPVQPQVDLPAPSPAAMNPTIPPPPAVKPQTSKILHPDPVAENPNRTPQTVTIPAGTVLAVRLRQLVSTDKQSEGDPFTATLDDPVIIDGFVIADRGSLVRGKVSSLTRASRGSSHAAIALELMEINTTDGQKVEVHTAQVSQAAASHPGREAAKVGAIAALGAIIGAAAGGGKGAAIGAGAGAAGGGGAVLASKGEEVRLPAETRLTFKLAEPITLTEKLK